jgi:hypothetical protein
VLETTLFWREFDVFLHETELIFRPNDLIKKMSNTKNKIDKTNYFRMKLRFSYTKEDNKVSPEDFINFDGSHFTL